jgi:hypothetical protein
MNEIAILSRFKGASFATTIGSRTIIYLSPLKMRNSDVHFCMGRADLKLPIELTIRRFRPARLAQNCLS